MGLTECIYKDYKVKVRSRLHIVSFHGTSRLHAYRVLHVHNSSALICNVQL